MEPKTDSSVGRPDKGQILLNLAIRIPIAKSQSLLPRMHRMQHGCVHHLWAKTFVKACAKQQNNTFNLKILVGFKGGNKGLVAWFGFCFTFKVFLCGSGWPRARCADRTGLEFAAILQLLPPPCWEYRHRPTIPALVGKCKSHPDNKKRAEEK